MHIILASASPRRRELIHQIGWTEDVLPSSFQEAETPEEAKTRIFEFPESVQQILSCKKGADLVTLFNACGKAKSIFEAKGQRHRSLQPIPSWCLMRISLASPKMRRRRAACSAASPDGRTKSRPGFLSIIRAMSIFMSRRRASISESYRLRRSIATSPPVNRWIKPARTASRARARSWFLV